MLTNIIPLADILIIQSTLPSCSICSPVYGGNPCVSLSNVRLFKWKRLQSWSIFIRLCGYIDCLAVWKLLRACSVLACLCGDTYISVDNVRVSACKTLYVVWITTHISAWIVLLCEKFYFLVHQSPVCVEIFKSCSVMACVWGPSRSMLGCSCENLYRLIKSSLICVKILTVLLNTCLPYRNPYRLAQYSSVCVKILILLFNTFMFVRKSLPPCSIFSCLREKSYRLLNRLWLQIYLWFI